MALSDERKQEIIEEEILRRSIRNPGIAAVLSFCFNGLGQIYNGHIIKGINIMAFSVIFMTAVVISAVYLTYLFWVTPQEVSISQLWMWLIVLGVGIIVVAGIGIYSICDAYNSAKIKK